MATKQAIDIQIGINHAPFLVNHFLYFDEEEYMSKIISSDKIKARHFHWTKHLIDDLCTINDGGEFGISLCVWVMSMYVWIIS